MCGLQKNGRQFSVKSHREPWIGRLWWITLRDRTMDSSVDPFFCNTAAWTATDCHLIWSSTNQRAAIDNDLEQLTDPEPSLSWPLLMAGMAPFLMLFWFGSCELWLFSLPYILLLILAIAWSFKAFSCTLAAMWIEKVPVKSFATESFFCVLCCTELLLPGCPIRNPEAKTLFNIKTQSAAKDFVRAMSGRSLAQRKIFVQQLWPLNLSEIGKQNSYGLFYVSQHKVQVDDVNVSKPNWVGLKAVFKICEECTSITIDALRTSFGNNLQHFIPAVLQPMKKCRACFPTKTPKLNARTLLSLNCKIDVRHGQFSCLVSVHGHLSWVLWRNQKINGVQVPGFRFSWGVPTNISSLKAKLRTNPPVTERLDVLLNKKLALRWSQEIWCRRWTFDTDCFWRCKGRVLRVRVRWATFDAGRRMWAFTVLSLLVDMHHALSYRTKNDTKHYRMCPAAKFMHRYDFERFQSWLATSNFCAPTFCTCECVQFYMTTMLSPHKVAAEDTSECREWFSVHSTRDNFSLKRLPVQHRPGRSQCFGRTSWRMCFGMRNAPFGPHFCLR